MGARFVGCAALVALAAGCGEAAPVEATDASLDAITGCRDLVGLAQR